MTRKQKRYRKYCDCGRIARHTVKILLYRSDLKSEVHAEMYLCDTCFILDQDLQAGRRFDPPKAKRLG